MPRASARVSDARSLLLVVEPNAECRNLPPFNKHVMEVKHSCTTLASSLEETTYAVEGFHALETAGRS